MKCFGSQYEIPARFCGRPSASSTRDSHHSQNCGPLVFFSFFFFPFFTTVRLKVRQRNLDERNNDNDKAVSACISVQSRSFKRRQTWQPVRNHIFLLAYTDVGRYTQHVYRECTSDDL